jgi:hypothetical protein
LLRAREKLRALLHALDGRQRRPALAASGDKNHEDTKTQSFG